jgi:hypothetical protein
MFPACGHEDLSLKPEAEVKASKSHLEACHRKVVAPLVM